MIVIHFKQPKLNLKREKVKMEFKTKVGTDVVNEEGKKVYVEVTSDYDLTENLKSFVKTYGEDVAFSYVTSQAKVVLQARVRALKAAGKTDEEIQADLNSYKLGTIAPRVKKEVSFEQIKNDFKNWSPEKQKEFLASLGV